MYALAPPASAERLLRIDERLRDKLRVAQRTIGVAGHILPSLVPLAIEHRGAAEAATDVRERLRSWIERGAAPASGNDACSTPMVAALASDVDGAIALVVQPGGPQLIADVGGCFDASPAAVDAALRAAHGPTLDVDDRGGRSTRRFNESTAGSTRDSARPPLSFRSSPRRVPGGWRSFVSRERCLAPRGTGARFWRRWPTPRDRPRSHRSPRAPNGSSIRSWRRTCPTKRGSGRSRRSASFMLDPRLRDATTPGAVVRSRSSSSSGHRADRLRRFHALRRQA